MNQCKRAQSHNQAPFRPRANELTPRSISPASRNSTPNDGATDWMAPNCPLPMAKTASLSTATCVTFGAISLSSSPSGVMQPTLWLRHCHGGLDRVGDEAMLMSKVVHFINLFRTGFSVPAPRDPRTQLDARDRHLAVGDFLHIAGCLILV